MTQKPEALIERMILASSREGGTIVDPFCGSGTTARVCQQLNRHCMAFEINPEYVEMSLARLAVPFDGFDSIDPRMARVPLDLRNPEIRKEYVENHKEWFLKHHEDAIRDLEKTVDVLYSLETRDQPSLF